jgi:hypothetical protein
MLALLTERYPADVLLIGCQPEELEDYGGSLRAANHPQGGAVFTLELPQA